MGITPVLRVPAREWDWTKGAFKKTEADHLRTVVEKLIGAWAGGTAYIDLSLLSSDTPVRGQHPLRYAVDTAAAAGVTLIPLARPESSPAFLAEAAGLSAHGYGIHLAQDTWHSVNPAELVGLLTTLKTVPAQVDIMVDFGTSTGPLVRVGVEAELASLGALGSFRSTTVGGSAAPDLRSSPRGVNEYDREDWLLYEDVRTRRASASLPTPDYLDHLIQFPGQMEQQVDPRFMLISAVLRYTVDDKWLVAKGTLYKANSRVKSSAPTGGAALIPALHLLQAHPEYTTPLRTQTDDWIDGVVAGIFSPASPQQWREWGSLRHMEVAVHQLSSRT
jgi:hypothetical protein